MSFSDKFLWGCSLAAHQCEGSFEGDGKGRGISEPENYKKPLVDFYHRYPEDIEMMAELGIKAFRMSIDWSRIYPDPYKEANEIGLNYYRKLLLALREKKIEPIVTLSHYEFPYQITEMEGWASKETIGLFIKYVKTVYERLGDLVDYWLTFNELNCESVPNHNKHSGIISDINDEQRTHRAQHNKLVASAKAVNLLREMHPNSKIGNMMGYFAIYPKTCSPDDNFKTMLKSNMLHHICGEVQVNGEYPYFAVNYYQKNNIDILMTEEEREELKKGTVDFISMSYYCSDVISAKEDRPIVSGNLVGGVDNDFIQKNDWGWHIDPIGLRFVLNDCYQRYKKPIIIVENGLGAYDKVEDGKVHDPYRIEYLHNHLTELRNAVEDGVCVFGYCLWSPIDIVSASAFTVQKRYGLIYVDTDDEGNGTMDRIKKDSFAYYKQVVFSDGEKI